MNLSSSCRWTALLLALAVACGPPKEAEDPRELLGEELEVGPAEPSGPAGPIEEPTSGEGSSRAATLDPPATRAECEAAAQRMVELGLRAAATDQEAPGSAAQLSASEQQKIINQAVDECLAWRTPRTEAQCVARAQEEHDIDRCVAK
jgi:hypothetical protein